MDRRRTRALAAAGLGGAAVVTLALVVAGGGEDPHQLRMVLPAATNVMTGQPVVVGAENVGSVADVDPVDGGRAARVTLDIHGDRWPLPADTRAEVRFGGTVSFSTRYVLLTPGRAAAKLRDGAVLGSVKTPVEIDSLLQAFDRPVRQDVKRLFDEGGPAARRLRAPLARALPQTPAMLDQVTSVLRDLTADQTALDGLLTHSSQVVSAADRAAPDVQVLLDGAAGTFDAVAAESTGLQQTLQRTPDALDQARTTLGKADGTLQDAGELTDRVAPGVRRLREVVTPVRTLLADLRTITPDAAATLRTARTGAPDVTRLLSTLGGLGPRLAGIGEQATEQVGCLRPYTPEAMLFFTTWGDWLGHDDGRDHVARANVQSFLPAQFNSSPLTPGQAKELYPQLQYGFPRPPGMLADQPWFQPQCGVGPDVIDPSKDQEAQHPDAAAMPPEAR